MEINDKTETAALFSAACYTPLFVFADSFYSACIFSGVFFAAHTATILVPTFAAGRLGKTTIFILACCASVLSVSLGASMIRFMDPLFFELYYGRIFFIAFTLPVAYAAIPENGNNRDRQIECIIKSVAFSVAFIVFGLVRELLASGTVCISACLGETHVLPLAGQAAGAFLLLGLIGAAYQACIALLKR